MTRMKAPSGGIVDVRDDAVRRLLAAGFTVVHEPKAAPRQAKRRTTRKKAGAQE